MCFITINYGDNEQLLVNPNCKKMSLMNYIREKCHYAGNALIDLLDENGGLAYIHEAGTHDSVRSYLEDKVTYIPVLIDKHPDSVQIFKRVKPLLQEWEKKYPELDRKIKILQGDIKGKRELRVIDGSRGLERKSSRLSPGRTGISATSSASKRLDPSRSTAEQSGRRHSLSSGVGQAGNKKSRELEVKTPETKKKADKTEKGSKK